MTFKFFYIFFFLALKFDSELRTFIDRKPNNFTQKVACLKRQDLQATNIILNPGLAFGTGDHPTTKLCLLLLYGVIKGGELFLDYGTGSGILAIAALKVL